MMELQMIFHWWYIIFTDRYIDGQIKISIKFHTVFLSVIWQTSCEKYRQNKADKCFLALFVYLLINYRWTCQQTKNYWWEFFWRIGFVGEPVVKIRTDRLWVQISVKIISGKTVKSDLELSKWIFFIEVYYFFKNF
jgi:hypothetical protein